jgi:hypothetical protein
MSPYNNIAIGLGVIRFHHNLVASRAIVGYYRKVNSAAVREDVGKIAVILVGEFAAFRTF